MDAYYITLLTTLYSIINYICIVDTYSNRHMIHNILSTSMFCCSFMEMWVRDICEVSPLSACLRGRNANLIDVPSNCIRPDLYFKLQGWCKNTKISLLDYFVPHKPTKKWEYRMGAASHSRRKNSSTITITTSFWQDKH